MMKHVLSLALLVCAASPVMASDCDLPEGPCDAGCCAITNGNFTWGITLNELFGPGTGLFNFDLNRAGAGGLFCYDAATGTITIEATAFGGNATEEVADMLYHTLVLLAAKGIDIADVWSELAKRRKWKSRWLTMHW